jgi:hypothetical protein
MKIAMELKNSSDAMIKAMPIYKFLLSIKGLLLIDGER